MNTVIPSEVEEPRCDSLKTNFARSLDPESVRGSG